jgi:hypothetical protein
MRATFLDYDFTVCLFASPSHLRFHVRLARPIFPLSLILFVHKFEPKPFLETATLQITSYLSIIRIGTGANASVRVLLGRFGLDDSLLLDGGLLVILAAITVAGDLALLGGLALDGALGLGSSLLSGSLGGRGVGRGHGAAGGGDGSVELLELLLGDAQHLTSRVGGLGTGQLRELLKVDLWERDRLCQLEFTMRYGVGDW